MPTDLNPPPPQRHRLGEWMAREEAHMAAFREKVAAEARAQAGDRLRTPAVQELARLFDDHAVLRMSLVRAIDEAVESGRRLGYASIGELMTVLDHLMTYTPPFSDASLIVCPINAFLDWPMCMPSGHAVFRDATVNAHLQNVLNVWCGFLGGPHSRTHLDTSAPDGWFCDAARKRIALSMRKDGDGGASRGGPRDNGNKPAPRSPAPQRQPERPAQQGAFGAALADALKRK